MKVSSGTDREELDKGSIGGVKGYLEGMFENPSLVKIQRKTIKKLRKKKTRKTWLKK